PQGPAARGDQREADGEPDHARGRRPRPGDGLPFPPAAGVLRPAGGPPVRGAGVREPLPPEAAVRSGRGGAGRRLGEDGAWLREAEGAVDRRTDRQSDRLRALESIGELALRMTSDV